MYTKFKTLLILIYFILKEVRNNSNCFRIYFSNAIYMVCLFSESVNVAAAIDPVIENLIALELSKLQMPQGQLNDFNMDER